MYVTLDILKQHGACQEALDFFAKHYPNGTEMLPLIKKAHIPESFLHWGYLWLETTPAEKQAYFDRLKIKDSTGVYNSKNITDCFNVSDSQNVSKSSVIKHSKNVTNSKIIYNSDYIEQSEHIHNSFMVTKSNNILNGKNIVNSDEVVDSNYVLNSSGVFASDNVVDSTAIWRSKDMTNCGFCFGCTGLSNSLFCDQQSNGEYLLFNKPITKSRFTMIYQQFNSEFLKPTLTLFDKSDTDVAEVKAHQDYRKHLDKIPLDFWTWVKTLPNYDPKIMYSITFNPIFLT